VKIINWIPAIIVRCTVFVTFYFVFGYLTSPMGNAHNLMPLMAPVVVLFETFSPSAYDYDNFLSVLLPGWIFWIVYFFVHKYTPKSWTQPDSRSTWAFFAPIFLLWALVYLVFSYFLHLYISIGKYENLFMVPFLPAMVVVAIFNNILNELMPVVRDVIYASAVFWAGVCVLYFKAHKLARKK
jgi:hypothetical protein